MNACSTSPLLNGPEVNAHVAEARRQAAGGD